MFKNILLATDFSDKAEIARDVTLNLVQGTKAKVTVATVYHPSDIMMWHGVFVPSKKTERYEQSVIKQMIAQKLHAYAKEIEKQGIKVSYVMKTGLVINGILKAAKETKADVIVIGSHSQRSLADVVMGGTAAGVQAKAGVPVLVASTRIKVSRKPSKSKKAPVKKAVSKKASKAKKR